MPRSAIPQHVLDRDWVGTDNDSWLMRLKKKVQYIFAAGPNVPSGFWRWRDIPVTLFAVRGEGMKHVLDEEQREGRFRAENSDGSTKIPIMDKWLYWNSILKPRTVYLSRIQPWCRWHISLQWPLFFNCHVIYCQKNVVTFPTYQSEFGIKKMFTFGIGIRS